MSSKRGLWRLTDARTDAKVVIAGHTYWRHRSTGLWWSKDSARHAGCAFKVYEIQSGKFVWIADANEYGDFIDSATKHKGPAGKFVVP